MRKKLIILIICFVLVILGSFNVSSVSISKILTDNVGAEGSTVIHILNSYTDIENATIIDYFDEAIEVKGYDLKKEEFLGQTKYALHIYIGNMSKGETKAVSYNITRAKTEAMLGADTYYLKGEFHQLAPKEVSIDVKSGQSYVYLYIIIIIVVLMIIILLAMHYSNYRRRKK